MNKVFGKKILWTATALWAASAVSAAAFEPDPFGREPDKAKPYAELEPSYNITSFMDAKPQPAAGIEKETDDIYFSADEMIDNKDMQTITAVGDVNIIRKDQTLKADKVIYNQKDDIVTAVGNVSIVQADGTVVFSDYVELDDKMTKGHMTDVRIIMKDETRIAASKFRKMAIRVHGKLRNGIRDKRHRRHVDQRGALADGAVVRRDLLLLISGRFLGGQDQLLAAVFAKIMDGPIRVDLLHGMDDRRFFEHPVLFRLAHAPGKDEAGPLVRDNGCRGRDAQGGRDDRRGQTDSGDPPDRFPLRSFRMEPLHGLRPDPAGSNELFFSDLDRDARQIVHHVGYFKLQRNNPLFPALPSASSGPGRASS